jgi:2-dehydropantoate 2-reductase
MAVVVWGAGAIGGVVGAWMARAGADVLLVDRDEAHVRAIRDRGLLVDGVRGELRVRPPAALPAEVEGLFDLVFLAVKCLHTEAALDALVPHLAPDGAVVSLQNGLNEEVIAARIGAQRTVGCFVNFGADWQAPGHIQHGGEHPIYLGELDGSRGERIERIRSLLGLFGEAVVTDNIWGHLWSKLCYGSLLFGTALVDAPVYEIVRDRRAGPVLFQLVKEVMAVAGALGIELERLDDYRPEEYEGHDWRPAMERSAAHFQGQVKVKTGVWRDLAVRGRRTEVDCQVGVAVQRGREIGIDLPLNRRLVELIHQIEAGERGMAWENFEAFPQPG